MNDLDDLALMTPDALAAWMVKHRASRVLIEGGKVEIELSPLAFAEDLERKRQEQLAGAAEVETKRQAEIAKNPPSPAQVAADAEVEWARTVAAEGSR